MKCLDLTSLGEGDDRQTIAGLCAKARMPLGGHPNVPVAAVCLRSDFVTQAVDLLAGTGVKVAAVAGGFPRPAALIAARCREISSAVASGADEIDAVITRELAQADSWADLYAEVSGLKKACGDGLLKMIIVSGELRDSHQIAGTSLVCMLAGADFVKTSTGYDRLNATLDAGRAMAAAIRLYHERTGYEVGLKPAGGIRAIDQAIEWLSLVRRELGKDWAQPRLFRIGASSLLD